MSKQIDDLRARYNTNGNAIIPNTFQHPNIFIDKLMYFLTPEENVCLTWAVRRILGFQSNIMSRKDNISLSQFTDGIVAKDGNWLSRGCGLGVNTIRVALESLEKYKILIPTTEKPNPSKGQEYWLVDNENLIDWDGLEERKSIKMISYKQRTSNATNRSLISRGYVGRKATVTSDVRQGVTSDVNTKPTETHRKISAVAAPARAQNPTPKTKTPNPADALWYPRSAFSEELLPLADLAVEKFGAPITEKKNNEVGLYIQTIKGWLSVGVTPADWKPALHIASTYSTPITKITGLTNALKTAAQNRKAREKQEQAQPEPKPEKKYISRVEAERLGLAKPIGVTL